MLVADAQALRMIVTFLDRIQDQRHHLDEEEGHIRAPDRLQENHEEDEAHQQEDHHLDVDVVQAIARIVATVEAEVAVRADRVAEADMVEGDECGEHVINRSTSTS